MPCGSRQDARVAGKIPVSYTGLRSLPRSPVALDRYLAGLPLRGWGPAPVMTCWPAWTLTV
jgi:hypothetical protein